METLQLLPDAVLRKQVCHECSQFLSVPPIMTSCSGETLCGRCYDFEDSELGYLFSPQFALFTKSAFNLIAERFLFKCINHLNGCKEILKFSETKNHEKTCSYKSQECFFCSFSGNLSQILNHCLKLHPQNVSFTGRFFFSLNDKPFKKQMILVLNDNMYHILFTVGDDSFTISTSPVTKCSPGKIDQYGVRFFKPEDPENVDYIHIDYGLLNDGMETFFEKSRTGLVNNFGPGAKLCCEVLVQEFTLEEKELLIKQKLDKLRQSEKDMDRYNQDLQDWAKKLSQQNENHQVAMNVIKNISSDFFKCHFCTKIALEEVYFCPKNHCVCKSCLNGICKSCNDSVQAFKKLEGIEKLMLSCDWAGCNESFTIKDYMKHRSECLQRPYKCPLMDCHKVIFSSQNLIEHWHCVVPALLVHCNEIICENYIQKEYYWLIKHDVCRVLINFDDQVIQVIIENINVLIPNQLSFECLGFDHVVDDYKNLTDTKFCGTFQVYVNNQILDRDPFRCDRVRNYTKLKIVCQ